MGRRFTFFITALVVGVAVGGVCSAGVPDPAFSDAPNVLVSPAGSLEYVVYVGDSGGPIDSANVQLVVSAEADSLVCWCLGETHPLLSAQSDINGEAHFFISGGGCINPDSVASASAPVQVFANGILLADVGVVSVDVVDNGGLLATQGWNPGGTCVAALGDATKHTGPISSGIWDYCTDLNSDLITDLTDAVMVTVPLSNGDACTQD